MEKNNPLWGLALLAIIIFVVLNFTLFLTNIDRTVELSGLLFSSFDSNTTTNTTINLTDFKPYLKIEVNTTCPDSVGGSDEAFLKVKYFYSKFCPWCLKEEPILKRALNSNGDFVQIEWYNINSCSKIASKYKVSGVPTFVFSTNDNRTEYSHYGFIPEKDLKKFVCDASGGCR